MTGAPGIVAIGLNCPLGQGLDVVGRAYRSGSRNFVKSVKGPIGVDGLPIVLSCVMPFDRVRSFKLRLQQLFAGAVEDLKAEAAMSGPLALRLVVPAWLMAHELGGQLRNWIVEIYPTLFDDVGLLADGDTVALYEVARALHEVGVGQAPALAVGALDSYMDTELLDLLTLNGRIHSRTTPHGLIPGEAAAIFIIAAPQGDKGSAVLGTVKSAFNGYERENLSAPQAALGRGLAKPLRRAFETYTPDRFLADLNGERWRSEDIGFALSSARIPDALLADFETPIGQTGDCGAANGLIMASVSLVPMSETDGAPDPTGNDIVGTVSIISSALPQGPRFVAVMEAFHRAEGTA